MAKFQGGVAEEFQCERILGVLLVVILHTWSDSCSFLHVCVSHVHEVDPGPSTRNPSPISSAMHLNQIAPLRL